MRGISSSHYSPRTPWVAGFQAVVLVHSPQLVRLWLCLLSWVRLSPACCIFFLSCPCQEKTILGKLLLSSVWNRSGAGCCQSPIGSCFSPMLHGEIYPSHTANFYFPSAPSLAKTGSIHLYQTNLTLFFHWVSSTLRSILLPFHCGHRGPGQSHLQVSLEMECLCLVPAHCYSCEQ